MVKSQLLCLGIQMLCVNTPLISINKQTSLLKFVNILNTNAYTCVLWFLASFEANFKCNVLKMEHVKIRKMPNSFSLLMADTTILLISWNGSLIHINNFQDWNLSIFYKNLLITLLAPPPMAKKINIILVSDYFRKTFITAS